MPVRGLFPVVALVLAVTAPVVPVWADHAHHSPAKVVKAALSGATVEGEDETGKTYVIRYRADGSASRMLDGKTESGNWTVDSGGHYCETWKQAYDGIKRCAGIEVTGPLLIIRGKIRTTRTIVETPPKTN